MRKLQRVPIVIIISSFFIAAVEGYIHLPSPIKKASHCGNTNYFDCKLQTTGMRPKAEWAIDSEAMRARGIIVLVKSN